ncbi:MAG: hypothetical protein BIFFINMI_00705 [Phycisphaerae bacterium]|nr:hypothetical protein [Phycisphaerae bacterium]
MNRKTIGLAGVVALMLSAVAFGGEPQWQNLPGANSDFKPGSLKLPLVVTERSGVARRGAVVTSGVPFPPGFLPDVGRLAVVDKDGKPVVSQATAMLTWHKPAYDDSAQWALVSFVADVDANATATYYLTDDGKSAPPASALKATRDEKAITVATGAAKFTIPLEGASLIGRAEIGGDDVLGDAGVVGRVTAGDWPDRTLKAGDVQTTTHVAEGVAVEESGPARVVVAIKGGFKPGDKEGGSYGFTARLYFAAGSPQVRLIYTVGNCRLDPTLHDTGNGRKGRLAYIWPMQDASLLVSLAGAEKAKATTLADGKTVSADGLAVIQSTLDGCKVTGDGRELATGKRHEGVIDLAGGGRGLAVTRRHFAEEWPGALEAKGGMIRVGLLPAESNETYCLNHGQRKSWDLLLTPHGAETPDLAALHNQADALLLFRPDPVWMVRAGGLTGAWSAGLALADAPAKVSMRRRPARASGPSKGGVGGSDGWDRFGVISSWNAGGAHWNENTAFSRWLQYGDGAEFDNSEIPTLWAADACPIQFDHPDYDACWPYVGYGSAEHTRMKVLTYPGYKNRCTWGLPDTGHMGMWMWLEYYQLTGDMRAREAAEHLGQMARGYLWRYTHDEKKDGTGALTGGQFRDFKRRDPDAEPGFKLDRRYIGWPLYCLAQYYQLTGDAAVLDEARIIARAFRNTARACPIGQLVAEPAGKNGTEVTEYSATFGFPNGNGGVASQVREWPKSASLVQSNFYSGIVIYGLREYYLVSHDVEALDTLVGQIDRFCHYSMIHDPQDQPAGWSYIFADYWGPYTWEDATNPKTGKSAAGFTGSNELVCDAIARIYPLSGRADLMDILKLARKANGTNTRTISVTMAVAYPKQDQTPPAAVKDLSAESAGAGSVRLTWTAPGGDGQEGQAAWYQVKYSPAKIVERVAGWPDRTEPLPGTRAEWFERANAFNAKQRSFWAAFNVEGEPDPAAAGTKQTMTVEGLAPGHYNFALKSWDRDMNISDVSNVVEVTVK